MKPNELVAGWRNKAKIIHDNPDDFSIGVRAGVKTCADGLELEIKRSNYVSGKEVDKEELKRLAFDTIVNIYSYQADSFAELLLSKYRIIKR